VAVGPTPQHLPEWSFCYHAGLIPSLSIHQRHREVAVLAPAVLSWKGQFSVSFDLQCVPRSKLAILHSPRAISSPWLGPLGSVPSASGANAHIPSLVFPTDSLDALDIVMIGAESEKRCCGACRLLLSLVYEPWLLMPVLGGRADALDASSNKAHYTPLGAIQGEAGGAGALLWPGGSSYHEGIDREVAGIRDVPASVVSEG